MGGDEDRRIPLCSHVATAELEIKALGKNGFGISGGLFLIDGDSLLHAIMRNCHLSNRGAMVQVLLDAGADPCTVSADGKRPFELDLQGRRQTWKREDRSTERNSLNGSKGGMLSSQQSTTAGRLAANPGR